MQGSHPRFDDYPEFTPTYTPKEMFQLGIFGGAYFRPIHSNIVEKDLRDQHEEFDFLEELDHDLVARDDFDFSLNKWGVKAGSSLREWESKGWIVAQDPYGWVQWYCRFYAGRRSQDDERQIGRWNRYAGPKSGRWRTRIINLIEKAGGPDHLNDPDVSPVIRQGLLQWAYEPTLEDYNLKKG